MIKINLKKQTYPRYQDLITKLVDYAYTRNTMVLEPGDFAVRGNIIDIFPANHSHPIRLEYDDQILDRLMSFNVNTQRSISEISETKIQSFDQLDHDLQVTGEIVNEDLVSNLFPDDYEIGRAHV